MAGPGGHFTLVSFSLYLLCKCPLCRDASRCTLGYEYCHLIILKDIERKKIYKS